MKTLTKSILAMTLLTVAAPAYAVDADVQQMTDEVRVFFTPPMGMSQQEYFDLQHAHGLSLSYRSQEAYDLLEPLLSKYPEAYPLHHLHGVLLLDLGQSEDALRAMDNFLATKRSQQLTHDQLFQIHRIRARAYAMEGSLDMALKVADTQFPDVKLLSPHLREPFYLSRVDIYTLADRPFEAYTTLQESIGSGLQSARSRSELNTLAVDLAEKLYLSGLNEVEKGQYYQAVEHFAAAYRLHPEETKYARNLGLAQQRFMRRYQRRFAQSRNVLLNAVSNMRNALNNEDYNLLYREYLRMKTNPDVAYLIRYKEYMPISLRDGIESIEDTLRMQGLKVDEAA